MKVIDLLNKIANGEIERGYKFEYRNKIVTIHFLIDNYLFLEILNDEIEFIKDDIEEEKKIPEKSILDVDSDANGSYDTVIINGAEYQISRVERYILGKINEIIDYLKNKGDE